ncbi:quinone oxidoreductase family protein [Amnibacterium endophyticum]|uniref:Zinc-binding alcohol dehydrogenase family protein n=1 Tax=Amnibacterium endophyticum TaxID=2109337 RepID=A0ABW4LHL4_9MICO
MPTRARQMIADRPGEPEVLRLVEAELPDPGPGEVLVRIAAAGLNPADFKSLERGGGEVPLRPGFEVVGSIAALGPGASIVGGGGAVDDRVVAFRVTGGYASALLVPARDVLRAPAALDDAQAANLLLAGTTAADLLHEAGVRGGETVLLHGASGAVGVSLLQQARELGVRVIGTASPERFDEVRRFAGEPVAYGDGLEQRVRDLAPDGIDAAFDCAGTEEAFAVSVALVADRARVLTVVAPDLAQRFGVRARGGENSRQYRDEARARVVALAEAGRLEVPVARTFALEEAPEALRLLRTGHPGGKLALVP